MSSFFTKSSNDGTKEQALGGMDYTLATQVPYMPWMQDLIL